MSSKALSHVWTHSKQKGAKLVVLLALADSANDDGFCWFGMTKLAKKCRQTADNTRDYIREVEADGEVVVYERKTEDGTFNYANLYKVIFPGAGDTPPDLRGQLRRREKPVKKATKRKGGKIGGTGEIGEGGTGEIGESDPSVFPLEDSAAIAVSYNDMKDSVTTHIYHGIEDYFRIGTVSSWLMGGVTKVKQSRKNCAVPPCAPPATLDELPLFMQWMKTHHDAIEVKQPTAVVEYFLKYRASKQRQNGNGSHASTDFSKTEADIDALLFEGTA